MKKTLSAICLLLSLVSCTKKLQVRPDPSVDAEGRTSVVASVDDFAGEAFVWPASARIGIYDSEGRSNCRYTLMNEFAGKSGEVSLYGAAVSGPLVAYYPFTEKGYPCIADRRQPVLREQKAGSSAMEHLALNTVLVAEDEDGVFRFSWRNGCTGLLHLTLKCPLEGAVEKVVFQCPGAPLAGNVALDPDAEPLVTDGSAVLTLTGVGKPCTQESPLEVWAQVPAGRYEHLAVTVISASDAVPAVAGEVLSVTPGGVTDATLEGGSPEAGNEDLTIIDGTYQ